jgi:hypothetical protein
VLDVIILDPDAENETKTVARHPTLELLGTASSAYDLCQSTATALLESHISMNPAARLGSDSIMSAGVVPRAHAITPPSYHAMRA